MSWEIVFYRAPSGKQPVVDFLRSLRPAERAKIGRTFDLVEQFGPRVGMPFVRHLGSDIWEMRTPYAGQTFRVFFFIDSNNLVAIHAIIKKTTKTPGKDVEIAADRMKDYLRRKGEEV